MSDLDKIRLRPLEKDDLRFVHKLDNNEIVMRYWFEEAYEAYVELCDLYDKHIHDLSERRFIIEKGGENLGLVELVEINHIHRRAEFQLIIDPIHQGHGYARVATRLAMNYAFSVLNLHKLYLLVGSDNKKALHIYKTIGFQVEGELKHEFFSSGQYRNAIRMCIFQSQFLPNTEHQTPVGWQPLPSHKNGKLFMRSLPSTTDEIIELGSETD